MTLSQATLKTHSYLRSRTAQGLGRLIRLHQAKTGVSYKYQIYFAEGYHYAWYYGEVPVKIEKPKANQPQVLTASGLEKVTDGSE